MGEDAPHPKYIIANADEMEPGTFKDRVLLEGDPHLMVEAMIVCGYAIEADIGYIFLRWAYRTAEKRLRKAIGEAYQAGYLGKNILGSGYDFRLEVHVSAGRYMCGEETGLLNSLEGKRATPTVQAALPTDQRFMGQADRGQQRGDPLQRAAYHQPRCGLVPGLSQTEDGGTKLYGVSGKVKRPGCVGTADGDDDARIDRRTCRGYAGGLESSRRAARRRLDGFSGGRAPGYPNGFQPRSEGRQPHGHRHADRDGRPDLPGGMVANLEHFFAQESCGWCTPCREGLPWTARILDAIEKWRRRMKAIWRSWLPTRNCSARGTLFAPWPPEPSSHCKARLKFYRDRFRTPYHRQQRVLGGKYVATIYIDGKSYEVDPGDNLLHAALSLGLDLPYFCWHPAMGSVGACRQCAVKQYKDEEDKQGQIVMACMTPANDGARISIKTRKWWIFEQRVIEWLMVNHPHDCPVCDEGGECHLQDMTVMTGHDYRRYRFQKRTYRNQYLGPLINHEMNRCIQCYRCVRFYNDYAGGDDLDVFGAHDHVYFGRHEDGVLENEFSGNLVEVCPTGVFTDKT